ncbi:hypothetical protein MCELHM10_02086 [Paracoccaceae bacterium]|jgi:hypothetical protein
MRRMFLTTTALVGLTVGLANADAITDSIVQNLQNQGYTNIDVLIGPTQVKVEAYQPSSKIEVIHDLATGALLKQETETLEVDDDEDFSSQVEIEDVAQDFLDSEGRPISDDEAFNDIFANQITNDLKAQGFTSIETLIGPTQVRTRAAKETGEIIERVYDRTTGALIHEVLSQAPADDDDFKAGSLIEDVDFDFIDSEGNVIVPEDDEEEVEDEAEEEDEQEDEQDDDSGDDDDEVHGDGDDNEDDA